MATGAGELLGAEPAIAGRRPEAGRGSPGSAAITTPLDRTSTGGSRTRPRGAARPRPPGVPPRVWRVAERTRRYGVRAAEAVAAAAARERARALAAERAEGAVAASCVAADADSAGESWAADAEEDAFTGRRALDGAASATIRGADAPTDSTDTTPGDSDGPGGTWWNRLGTSPCGNASRTTGDDNAVAALSGLSSGGAARTSAAPVQVGPGHNSAAPTISGDAGGPADHARPAPAGGGHPRTGAGPAV